MFIMFFVQETHFLQIAKYFTNPDEVVVFLKEVPLTVFIDGPVPIYEPSAATNSLLEASRINIII